MTEATTIRPTTAGAIKFAALYAALLATPAALTVVLSRGIDGAALMGLAAWFGVAFLVFFAIVRAGWYTLRLTDGGLETRALGRTSVLAWPAIDHFETSSFLGWEIFVKARGRGDDSRTGADLAAIGAYLYPMTPPELRDYLTIELNRRTGSPT